ncbi:MAG: RNA polymerase sigma factor [Bacteroidia bacterium]
MSIKLFSSLVFYMDLQDLYKKYKRMVFNLALQYVHNREDAEEVLQDVFVKVHEKLHTFRAEANVKTWIYRITIHQSLDFLKAKKAQKRWSFFSAFSLQQEEKPIEIPHFDHPGVEMEQKESLANIFACIHQLPENQKTALILLKIEQQSQAEVAEIMDLSIKAVESLFQRAKKNLEKLLSSSEGIEK